jgi:hypothetical protein
MAKPPKWNLYTIERACRREMRRTWIRFEKPKDGQESANAIWLVGGPALITSDRFMVGDLRAILHELTHRVLDKELAPFRDYIPNQKPAKRDAQECMVDALEDAMFEMVWKDEKKSEWWRDAIQKRTK